MRGFTIESDAALEDGELVKLAACFLFGDTKWVVGAWPHEWSESLLSDKSRIKQLVAAEDGRKPLSDHRISDILAQQGIQVARRTVAKYREAMHIQPANLRKSI